MKNFFPTLCAKLATARDESEAIEAWHRFLMRDGTDGDLQDARAKLHEGDACSAIELADRTVAVRAREAAPPLRARRGR
jgi:hypothetical protein